MSRKTYDREAVLAATMHAFWRLGYQGASVQELCEATGLNRKTLYHEFADKASLFGEAVAMYTTAGTEQARQVLTAKPLGKDNIRRYFRGMRYDQDCRGCLMTMTINERPHVPQAALEPVRGALRQIEAWLRANLRAEGMDRRTARRLTTFLVFSIQGITTMGKLEGDNSRLRDTVETILGVLG